MVNRSHFDETEPATLDPDDYRMVTTVIAGLRIKTIDVMSHVLSVTDHGRIILQCLPVDDGVQRLREGITAAIPRLRVHLPRTAHVKIAHLRKALVGDELAYLFTALQQISTYVVGKLTFTDVYTPLGRIPL
jgi:hypothetical protein